MSVTFNQYSGARPPIVATWFAMPAAEPHREEHLRLSELRQLNILDTPPEQAYDDIARLAARICGTPIGLVSLVDEDRQWFKASCGLDVTETPRSEAFCAHAIHTPGVAMVVSDATQDPRFHDNPLVRNEPHIRFYAGIPLLTSEERMPVGTLCVISNEVMSIDEEQLESLTTLASHAERLLHLREAQNAVAQRDLLIDASNDAIVSWSEDKGVLTWNKGAEKLYGVSEKDARGRSPWELHDSRELLRRIANDLKSGEDWTGTTLQKCSNGTERTLSTRLQRVGIGNEAVFLETSRDITQEEQTKLHLLQSQKAMDTAADAIMWIRGGTTEILYVNEEACRRYQYTRDEFLKLTIKDIDPMMLSPEKAKEIRERAKLTPRLIFESTHVAKDGTQLPVEIASNRMECQGETLVFTTIRDLTERIATKKQLQAVTTELQLIFEALPLAVVTTTPDRKITKVNKAFRDVFGYSESEVIGQPTQMLYADENDFHEQGQIRFGTKKTINLQPYEIEYRRKSGEIFVSQTIGTQITNDRGEPIGNLALIEDISERVNARKKLEELSEDRRAMLQLLGTSDGVWSWQLGTDHCHFAPGYRKMLGFDGEDRVAFPDSLQTFQERLHPDDADNVWRQVNRSLEEGIPVAEEFRLRHANGYYIWVRARGNAIFSDNGTPVRMAGSIHDITDLKVAEAEREHFFRIGVQHYGISNIETTTWVKASDNWEEVLGFRSDQLRGRNFLDDAHPEDRPKYIEHVENLKQGIPVHAFVGRMRHMDGSYRWIEWYVSPPEEDSPLIYFTARDVTDEDQNVLRKIADAIPQTLFVFDMQSRQNVFVSRQITELLGFSQAELIGYGKATITSLVEPKDLSKTLQFFEKIAAGQDDETFSLDVRLKGKDGKYREVYAIARILKRSANGVVQQFVGTATQVDDITILRRYAGDLEEANRELENFAYVASHDLKQPLRGIDNLSNWIQEDAGDLLPDVAKEHIKKLKGRVFRMERLLDDLLAYSRVGRIAAAVETVDMTRLIDEVVDVLAPPAGFEVRYEGSVPAIRTERVPLEQILRNLIGNAIKHRDRDDGGVVVTSRLERNILWCSVKDDGPGIAPEFHERIFRMFQTLRPRDEVEASGMGLAIAKKHIECRGGKISVESEPNDGTTFTFTWPVEQGPA